MKPFIVLSAVAMDTKQLARGAMARAQTEAELNLALKAGVDPKREYFAIIQAISPLLRTKEAYAKHGCNGIQGNQTASAPARNGALQTRRAGHAGIDVAETLSVPLSYGYTLLEPSGRQ